MISIAEFRKRRRKKDMEKARTKEKEEAERRSKKRYHSDARSDRPGAIPASAWSSATSHEHAIASASTKAQPPSKKAKKSSGGVLSNIIAGVEATFRKSPKSSGKDADDHYGKGDAASSTKNVLGQDNVLNQKKKKSSKTQSGNDTTVTSASNIAMAKTKAKTNAKTTSWLDKKVVKEIPAKCSKETRTKKTIHSANQTKKRRAKTKRKPAQQPKKKELVIIDLLSSSDEDEDQDGGEASVEESTLSSSNPPLHKTTVLKQIPNVSAKKQQVVPINGGTKKRSATDSQNISSTKDSSYTVLQKHSDLHEYEDEIDPSEVLCWSCGVSLESENENAFNSFVHSHPLLGVATCSVCADRAYVVEDDVLAAIEDSKESRGHEALTIHEMDICSWCAHELHQGEHLLICDDCPRTFCNLCVSLAHGSGSKGQGAVNELLNDDGPWSCIYCTPTRVLDSMRAFLADGGGEVSRIKGPEKANMNKSDGNGAAKDNGCLEELLDKLSDLEDDLEETERMLEGKGLDRKRAELKKEGKHSPTEIQDQLNDWMVMTIDRHSRISDAIGILQDDLDYMGIDLSLFYKNRERNGDDVESFKSTDDWKLKADIELDKRDAELGFQKGAVKGASGWKGGEENYKELDELNPSELNEIEDINSTEEAIEQLERIVQRKKHGPNASSSGSFLDSNVIRKFKKIIPLDDRELKELKATVIMRSETGDKIQEKRLYGKTNVAIKRKNSSALRVVLRNKAHINEKKQASYRRSASNQTQNMNENARFGLTHQVDKEYGDKSTCFVNSNCILVPSPFPADKEKDIAVAAPIAKLLKPHQIEGIKFMWNNTFCDLLSERSQNEDAAEIDRHYAGGCILAHNMGLGKSIQVVALIHTLLTHPRLVRNVHQDVPNRIIKCILLIVPVNTLVNWKTEFDKWTMNLPNFILYDFSSTGKASRRILAQRWEETGGVMLITHDTLSRACKETRKDYNFHRYFQSPGADAVIIDEGHIMLKNNRTGISKTLGAIKTSRRIVLTGTPLQNNLIEFYRMADWIRPGCLGTESQFEKEYALTIMDSLTSDATSEVHELGAKLLKKLFDILSPYIQRLDSTVLERDLPYMQQAVIHVKQTKVQAKLYRAFKKYQQKSSSNSFIEQYSRLFPINNHPGTLLLRRSSTSSKDSKMRRSGAKENAQIAETEPTSNQIVEISSSKEESNKSVDATRVDGNELVLKMSKSSVKIIVIDDSSDEEDAKLAHTDNSSDHYVSNNQEDTDILSKTKTEEVWWSQVHKKVPDMAAIQNGAKAMLLLQILAHSELIGDKVVVFSQCLKTLDYIESIIRLPDWGNEVPGVANLSRDSGKTFGGWTNGKDYLRIDGQTSAFERGVLIDQFNDVKAEKKRDSSGGDLVLDERLKTFLISTRAGNAGINLIGANRVIIFDSAWNPVLDQQALYRCYRYGQVKPVYAYRFLTEGTMEEKVFSRSVNKTSLAARVIDQKDPKRNFTQRELSDIMAIDTWVQCDRCDKWRMLPPKVNTEELPDFWHCGMNTYDKARSRCSAKERSAIFMHDFFASLEFKAQTGNTFESQTQTSQLPESQDLPRESVDSKVSEDADHIKNTRRDTILMGLTTAEAPVVPSKKKKSGKETMRAPKPLITKYYFHDSLMKEAKSTA